MPLPTCQCNAGLPTQQQLGNIYCALLQIAGGTSGTSEFNNIVVNGNAWFKGTVEDGSGSVGTAGQIFTSTGTGTAWSSVYTLRVAGVSTTTEHLLVADFLAVGNDTANVLSLRHTDAVNGCSAVRCFTPGTFNETGAFGVGGTFSSSLYHCVYVETSDQQNSGSGLPLRLIQRSTLGGTKTYASAQRFEISNASGGVMTFYESTGATSVMAISDIAVTITGTLTATGNQSALYRHTEAAGVDGGTATSGSWLTCPLNVETYDPGNYGTLSGNQVTLIAGTYEYDATQVFVAVNLAQIRLYNVTDAAVVSGSEGLTCYFPGGGSIAFARTVGKFTIAAAKAIRLEYQVQTTVLTVGLGANQGWGTNVYATLLFKRVGP